MGVKQNCPGVSPSVSSIWITPFPFWFIIKSSNFFDFDFVEGIGKNSTLVEKWRRDMGKINLGIGFFISLE